MNMDKQESNWKLVYEYGENCKTYVDKNSIESNGVKKTAWVRS